MIINLTDANHNMTDVIEAPPQEQFVLYVATVAITLSLTGISIWLAITIGMYGSKSGKFQRQIRADFSGGMILKLLLLAALAVMPRIVSTLIVTLVGFESGSEGDYECEIAVDVSIGAYYIALVPPYSFLWFRQRALYLQPSIERLYTTKIKVISWGCLIFLATSGLGILVIFVLPLAYQASPGGCILRDEEEENVTVFYILFVFQVSGQVTLLSLFIYPLHVHRNVQVSYPATPMKNAEKQSSTLHSDQTLSAQTEEESVNNLSSSKFHSGELASPSPKRKSFGTKAIQTISNFKQNHLQVPSQTHVKKQNNNFQKTGRRIMRVMRRSVISAVICISSDLTALALVGFVFPKQTAKGFTNAVFDISLIVNIISLICSFETYRKIFKAPCIKSSTPKQSLVTSSGDHSPNNNENLKNEETRNKNEIHRLKQ